MKKALIAASVASMIDQFNLSNIQLLQALGYQVDIACNFEKGNTCSAAQVDRLKERMRAEGVGCYQIDFSRNMKHVGENLRAWRQLAKLAEQPYSLVHLQSPIGGVLGRIVFSGRRRTGTRVLYTAHGFHFYQEAPRANWLLYYPVEKLCSRWTDVLITINREDYALAKERSLAPRVEYVPGVGVDLTRFSDEAQGRFDTAAIRRELGVGEQGLLLLSVGELNDNKNHRVVIEALGRLRDPRIHYAIAGQGKNRETLLNLARENRVEDRVHLLGFQADIVPWYAAADLFVHPSFREGLPVALMEAMASGLPCVVSRVRGNRELIDEAGGALFAPDHAEELAACIRQLSQAGRKPLGEHNRIVIQNYSRELVDREMRRIYS